MAEAGTLHDAFIEELRGTYNAEKQLTKALPKIAKAASSPICVPLSSRTSRRRRGMWSGSRRSLPVSTRKSAASTVRTSRDIIEVGKSIMEEDFDESTMDACLIAAGQLAEHFEMAAYGTLVAWARAMGHDEAAELLEQTLEEEEAADQKLTSLAQSRINRDAAEVAHPEGSAKGREMVDAGKKGSPPLGNAAPARASHARDRSPQAGHRVPPLSPRSNTGSPAIALPT